MKFKQKTKDYKLLIKTKTSFSEEINEKELDRFSRAFFRGFFRPNLIKKNLIEYTGPIGISLYDKFKKPMSKRDILFVIEHIVVAVNKLQVNKFGLNNLVMNLKYVYINEVTKEVQFIYLPLVNRFENLNLIEFIEAVTYSIIPADEKAKDLISRFVYFFKSMKPFDIKKIEAFIAKEDRSVVNIIKKQNVGQSGFMTNKQQHYYEHYDKTVESAADDEVTDLLKDDEATSLMLEDDEATNILIEDNDESTGLLSDDESTSLLSDDESTSLLSDDEATGILDENKLDFSFPTLVRTLTNENISVNKPVFRLGKEKSYVDYFVSNNAAVSRSHADIILRGDKYFVTDLNSKNHTYVNDEQLPCYTEIEIHDGDRLRLGNEEFIFNSKA